MVGVAQSVRAPDCGSGGRRFDSGRSPSQYFCVAVYESVSEYLDKSRLLVLTPLRTQYILDVLQRTSDSSVVRCILLVGTKCPPRSHLFLRWAKLIEN